MNKIFRVVWSHTAQSWVAVSELTSAKGKTKSKTISKLAALSLVAGTALSMDAMAASSTITAVSKTNGNLAILTNNQASINAQSTDATTPKNVIYIGNGRVPSSIGDEFVAIGNDMNGNSSGNAGDTLIGNRVRSGGGGQDSFATAVGYAAQVSGPSVSIGVGTSSDIGSDRGWEAVKDSGVAIGAFSRVSGSANGGVAMGAISFADQTGSVAIGQLSGAASLIYDREVKNPGNGGIVYRNIDESTGGNLVSIGAEAGARSTSSVAIGTQATTSKGNDSIAMGTNSAAIKNNSIAIGHAAIAGGHTQADIDALDDRKMLLEAHKANADKRLQEKTDKAKADPTAENKFQLSAAKAAVERLDLAIKRINEDIKRLSSSTTRDATNAIAIGNQSQATDESALAFGNTARAKGVASIAQGKNTQATAENAIAVGTSSNVSGANSVALGANITKLTTANSVVLGANSTEVVGTTGASHEVKEVTDATVRTIAGPNFTYSGFAGKPADAGHYVSIGQKGSERQIKNLAAGTVTPTSTDAINGSQLYALMDRVENKQEPVVYTNKAGDKLVKVGNNFYKTTDLDDKGQPKNVDQNVPNDDVIASMNNAGNNTTTPMVLANIAGNLPGAKNGSTAPTTSGTLPEGADAPNTSNAATVGDVLNAGWNLTEKSEVRDFVKPYDTVDFIDGKGTSVNVTTDTDGKVSHIKYDVKAADDSITVGKDGIKVNTGEFAEPVSPAKDDTSGQVAPKEGDNKKVASVGDVANAINNAFWKVTGDEDGGKFTEDNKTSIESVKAGNTVTFKAGKNIKLKQDGKNFTYSLNPELTDITSIGGNGTTMTFNPEGVDLGNKKITGVKSALDAKPVTTTPGTPVTEQPNLVNLGTKPGEKALPDNVLNSAATVRDLANMGWLVSSDKTTGALSAEYKDTVKNANEVKFIGTGAATVSGKTVNGIRTITVDVKQPEPETETLTSTGGKVTNPEGDNAKKLVTAGNVADMINKSGFNLKTSADKNSNGEKAKGTKNDGELINPGATVEMVAGKNMSVKQDADGKVTYATKEDVEFTSVKLGKAEENGKQPVNLKTENATPADNNQDSKAPTTALNFSSGEGDKATPTQLKGVGSVLNTKKVPTAPEGKTTPEDKQPKLVNLGSEDAPLSDDVLNSAATVRDLANMGWVVGAPENGYVDTVKNANKVDFKGENGISVTGKTNDKGVREITISVAEGKVTNDVTVTKADGTVINGVKGPDGKLYEKGQDGKPDSSKEITLAEGDKVNNEGSKFVSGNAVATAIQESGWNIGKAEAKDVTKAFEKEAKVHDKVNPNDDVKFVDGQNTVVKMVTVDAKNEDGSKKATTFVKVDVTGLPVQYTDKNGTPVTKVGDKYFTVDDKGNPTTTEVAPENLTTNMVNPAAKPNEIGAPTTLGNVKSNLPETKNGNNPTLNQAAPTDEDAAKVKNNAATVSDVLNAGWNLQNNGKDKDFVKPYDTVNFVDGKGTKAVVETTPNGTTSNVKFDVDTGTVTSNKDGSVSGPVTPEMQKALDDAKKVLADATTPEAKKAAQDKVDAAQTNINNAGNQIATAQGVADAINKSGFTLATSANGGEKISGTPEMINPGKKVEMVAGKNMTVKQESNGKVTYATASNVTFDSVQFGDNGPKITNNGGNINVGTATGAPTKITGVAPGEISSTSTDAINGSQLHSVASDINNRIGSLDNKIDMADKNLRGGVAQAIAAAGLVQAYLPGKSLLAIGGGVYRGEAGYAIGYSSISDNGNWIIKGTASGNSRGHFGASTSVGYQW
ncbi:YadA-like family protein [Neisseria sp. RH3002v2f]|uniref:YadA-like family protein n=1 Tax=Neisseria sp. RH3002v2f TaxID=1871108 RepID=UPI001660ACB2|nr:YadA-like family protein [Neisseria sp. RH3002v2f]MBD0764395.1 hypothetical protein [Neisseria sp. RH3002v2f]